ncbi:unnamed protein product, partial [Staurois parvus]
QGISILLEPERKLLQALASAGLHTDRSHKTADEKRYLAVYIY